MIRIDTNDVNITLRDIPTNWGAGVWLYNGELFTGIMYEYFPTTNQLCSEVELKEGILDGRQVEYWPNGKLKIEHFEKYDTIYGTFKKWDEQGILISYVEYDNNGNLIKKII
jgi:antitoxin component YwqK of YwqJK toxin-antitoxin module